MATSIFAPAPAPGPAIQPGGNEVAAVPVVAPGGNERPPAAATPVGGGVYGAPTPAQAPGAAHAVQTALGAALGAPKAVGGNVTQPSAATGLPSPTAFGPPPSQLAANPAYVAFLNSLGLSDADLQNQAIATAGQDWITEAGNQAAQQNALANAQTRTNNVEAGVGLENSSQNLNAQALNQQATNAKIAALQQNTAAAVNKVYNTLAAQQAQGGQNLANLGTNVAGASNIQNQVAANPTGAFAVGG